MAYTTKVWYDAPNPNTPLSAAAMNDLEARIAAAATQADAYNLQPSTRCYNTAALAIANATAVVLGFDTNRYDSDSSHYTSAAALTGTVAKTAASAALVGTGTSFTSQLSVGQVISVPGTAAEKRVVTSITSDTALTVSANFANTASGQTATRVNSALVARQAGVYSIFANVQYASNATGRRELYITHSSGLNIAADGRTSSGALTPISVATHYKLAQWDYVETVAVQTSGGSLNIEALGNYSPEFGMFRVAAG